MVKIILLGTSHVSKQSIKKIKQQFDKNKIDVVALELDQIRVKSLFSKQKNKNSLSTIKEFGLFGGLFIIIGAFIQKKLGNQVGMLPGEEMKQGILLGKQNDSKIILIDKNIKQTIKGISKIPFSEKTKIFFDILLGLLITPFLKIYSKFSKNKESIFEFDLKQIPSKNTIRKMMNVFEERYPHLYSELIHKRNKLMAQRTIKLIDVYSPETILLIIGAGHVDGIKEILNKHFKNNKTTQLIEV